MTPLLRALIVEHARATGLESSLVEALVMVESSGNTWSWNPEPRYRYFWDVKLRKPFRTLTPAEVAAEAPPADFRSLAGDPDQEWWAQQASFGPMQVMGAVARELGCTLPYLTELCDPNVGIRYGCLKLAAELKWAKGDTMAALASFNGGRAGNTPGGTLRNAGYAGKVLTRRQALTVA